MKYIKRHLEKILGKPGFGNKVIAITGARQTGKSTLLKHAIPKIKRVSFDDDRTLDQAINEPSLFIKENAKPLFVDEVQYAPSVFSYIKIEVDEHEEDYQYYLTGSQKFNMMKDLTESLAGRVGIYELLGLSMREINNDNFNTPFMPNEEYLKTRKPKTKEFNLWKCIHSGSYPEMHAKNYNWNKFYSGYVKTYLERDVKSLTQVGDLIKFRTFMQVVAAHIGQMINYSKIANDVGISEPTAQRWMSVLMASNIVFILPPYYNNAIKRAVKTPKLYFLDTGLAAYLTKWDTPQVLKNGAMNGAYFENFVICEILKSYYNAGLEPDNFYFYRDKEKKEIDLIIKKGDVLYPIEIKLTAHPTKKMVDNFEVLNKVSKTKVGEGAIVCDDERVYSLKEGVRIVPYWYI